MGWALLLIGVVAVIYAAGMNTTVETGTVYGRVHNIGLVSDRNTVLGLGALSCLVAVLMLLRRRSPPSVASTHAGSRVCPFCAESIQAMALVCRHCARDLPPAPVDLDAPQDQVMAQLGIKYVDGMYEVCGTRHFRYREAVRQAAAAAGLTVIGGPSSAD